MQALQPGTVETPSDTPVPAEPEEEAAPDSQVPWAYMAVHSHALVAIQWAQVATRYQTPILRSPFTVPLKSPGYEGLPPFLSVSDLFNGKEWSTSRFNSQQAIFCSCNLPPDLPSKRQGFTLCYRMKLYDII